MSFSKCKSFCNVVGINGYNEVTIDKLIWKTRNLSRTIDNDGCELIFGKDYFYPNDDKELIGKYGLLYTRSAAMRIVEHGWRIPTINDWNSLKSSTYGVDCDMSRVIDEQLWLDITPKNKRQSFLAVPSGKMAIRFYESDFGNAMYVWLNPNENGDFGIKTPFGYVSKDKIMYVRNAHKDNAFSVRLVKCV